MQPEFKDVRAGDASLADIERRQGAPVILGHGREATDARAWGPQLEPFAEHYRVIAYR